MIRLAKRCILRSINRAGYRLLKDAEHEELLRARATPLAPDVAPIPGDGTPLSAGCADLPPLWVLALHSAVRYLRDAGIEGDVVDCSQGGTATLTVLARALLALGDSSRRLVLFDTTADPRHRPEVELDLWGTDRDRLSPAPARSNRRLVEPAPPELAASGYPIENVSIRRYPREAIAQSGPVAFLGLTSATYPSNRTAIATFFPRVSPAGVIAVASEPGDTGRRDAVEEFLRDASINLLLVRVAPSYRIGVTR